MTKNRIAWCLMVSIIGLIIIACGCKAVEKIQSALTVQGEKPVGFSLSTIQPDDIPVPANFVHQPNDSIYYIDGDVRTASIKYVASDFVTTDSVIAFYEKYMPTYGWQKVAEASAGWKKVRAFIKGKETCEILVEKMQNQTDLYVKISPQQK